MADDTTPTDPGSADSGGSDTTDSAVDFQAMGAGLAAGGFPNLDANAVSDFIQNGLLKYAVAHHKFFWDKLVEVCTDVGKAVAAADEAAAPVVGAFAAPIVAGMLGASVDPSSFADTGDSGARDAVAQALVDAFVAKITNGATGPIEADDSGAKNIAQIGLHAAIEGWLLAAVPELLASMIPIADVRLDALGDLPKEVASALGIGRMVRGALRPLIQATATIPMQWQAYAQYRPTKLPPNVAVKQFLRGAWDAGTLNDSLARDGYRDEDMDALVNDATKFLPLNELQLLLLDGLISTAEAVQTLTNSGYDDQTASKIVNAGPLRRQDAINSRIAAAVVDAYAANRINDAQLADMLDATLGDRLDKPWLQTEAIARRALMRTGLTPTEAHACVLAGIVPIEDYTAALQQAGRTQDAIDALEMLLRKQLDDKTTADQAKAATAAARAAAATAKAAATQAHAAVVQEAAQRKALGALGTLERAVIHGLIPIDRLEQLLALEFPADTVAIYVADVQQRRATYVAQQAKAAAAAQKATAKGLSIGALRAAFLDQIISANDVETQLAAGGMTPDDISVIVATWQQALEAKQAAAKLRADAQARTATKHLSLAEAETLTVSGHWQLADFNAYLSTLGYDDGDIAHLDQIVQDRIAKQSTARTVKAAASATNPIKGLTLGQEQRAVVLGTKTLTDFQTFLVNAGYTADAIAALVAQTQTAVDAADAARARRSSAATAEDGRPVPLAEVTRAARLGLVTPADYQTALTSRGFTPDAIALELQLLSYEIANAKQPAPAAGSAAAAIAASGTVPLTFATKRHVDIIGELAGKGISLADAENAVKNNEMTYDAYETWLENNGYSVADATLLRALLGIKLGAPGS